jgi:hypothetical protein
MKYDVSQACPLSRVNWQADIPSLLKRLSTRSSPGDGVDGVLVPTLS